MKAFGAGALIVAVLALANVVGAGVFMVLGPLAMNAFNDEVLQLVAGLVVGAIAVAAAVFLIIGAMQVARPR